MLRRVNEKLSCRYGGLTVPPISKGCTKSGFQLLKKAIFQCEHSPVHAMVTLIYRTLQWTLRYGNLAHAGDGCSKFTFKIAAKRLLCTDMVTIDRLCMNSSWP